MSPKSESESQNSASSTDDSDPLKLLQKLADEYERADTFCKRVKSFVEEAGIPAANELRYAGHHAILAVCASPTTPRVDHLRKAISHCQRATYEAGEAGILVALEKIYTFTADYKQVIVGTVVTNYQGILRRAQQAQKRVTEPRETNDHRDNDHETHVRIFDELVEDCNALDLARDELNKALDHDSRDGKRHNTNLSASVIIGALAIAVAVYFGLKQTSIPYAPPPAAPIQQAPAGEAAKGKLPPASGSESQSGRQ